VSPTGIAADPELTSHGVDQSKQLAARLLEVDPPIERVYSSPYYRCLQTIEPFVSRKSKLIGHDGHEGTKLMIRAEPGVGEWFGSAPFEHPTSAALDVLKPMFPGIDLSYEPITRPTRTGESLAELHDRVAATMQEIISQCDRDGIRAIVICTHAAVVIALGRVLTGAMPESVDVEDFSAFTCGLSTYRRKKTSGSFAANNNGNKPNSGELGAARAPAEANSLQVSTPTPQAASPSVPKRRGDGVAVPAWKGCGVAGGWDCTSNSDCSHLAAGEERGW
jgi:transcription factor C subunit 7